jgi:poly(3-hydroxybutyrate) depolymerase
MCDDLHDAGFMVMAMTGIGAPNNNNSWRLSGSVGSPGGPTGRMCNIDAYFDCYADCGHCEDSCWWTTCQDSIAQTVEMIDYVLDNFCIDLSRVWSLGCSNGGIYQFELARDFRTHNLLAGVVSMVGIPLYGHNYGPSSPMHFLGIWGLNDATVPPKAGVADDGSFIADRSSQKQGRLYQTAESTTAKWAEVL